MVAKVFYSNGDIEDYDLNEYAIQFEIGGIIVSTKERVATTDEEGVIHPNGAERKVPRLFIPYARLRGLEFQD